MVNFEISNIFAGKNRKKKSMTHFIGIGNALVDTLYQVPDDAVLQELHLAKGAMQLIDTEQFKTISRRMSAQPSQLATGGSACNTVMALSQLGAPAGLVGKVSDDANGRFFANRFSGLGVRTRLLSDTLPTGVASTFITPDGQRTFATYLGAAARLSAADVEPDWFAGYDCLYLEGYLVQNHELISRIVSTARAAGVTVCLDLASYNIVESDRGFFSDLLRQTDIVFANEDEARAYTGHEPAAALEALADLCSVAVVKAGAAGALAASGAERAAEPAEDVPGVADTTGAGDYFSAGFLYAHAQGRPLAECLRVGGVLAAAVIQVVGTGLTPDVWADVRRRVG